MSKILEPTDLTRLAWTTALRTQGHRKCRKILWGFGPEVCAMALLAETVGETRNTFSGYESVGSKAGLQAMQIDEVMAMNDGMACSTEQTRWLNKPQTFAKIADVIDSWFAPEKSK